MGTEDEIDCGEDTICCICYAEFLDPEDLKIHVDQVHITDASPKRFCPFCPRSFVTLEEYILHLRDEHVINFKCCQYCSRAFTDLQLLKDHEKKHVTGKNYSCSHCKSVFEDRYNLQDHEFDLHRNENDGTLLRECLPLLSSYLNIKAMDFINSLGTSTVYVCVKCQFTSVDVHEYLNHLKTSSCKSVVCNKCCNVYKDKRGLLKHLKNRQDCKDNGTDVARKECLLCDKEIPITYFQEHKKSCKAIKCHSCQIVFATLNELSKHQAEEHPLAITLTMCQFCHREFIGTVQVEKHIERVHKSQFHLYKYACVYCENAFFKHPNNLFGHFFTKHPNLQPFSCKICNITFRVRKKFSLHIKLEHKSVGFVEFDDKYHVYFTDKKSENAFTPTCLFADRLAQNTVNVDTDDQTDAPTDADTDQKSELKERSGKKPAKLRYKEQKSEKDTMYLNILTNTETEENQTDVNTEIRQKLKRKSKINRGKPKKSKKVQSDSSDEPLIFVKKREKQKKFSKHATFSNKMKVLKNNKKTLTCNICNKYCYTFQNYNHHVSLHYKNESKKCMKCYETFKSKAALETHMSKDHATSKLTETLKNLIQRRKSGVKHQSPELTVAQKFQKTIKKVQANKSSSAATIAEVKDKLSVQNFIENFKPDIGGETPQRVKEENQLLGTNSNCLLITTVNRTMWNPPAIKMTKFIPKPMPTSNKLAMPVKFKQDLEHHKVTVKLIQKPGVYYVEEIQHEETESFVDNDEDNRNDVPDVAQEVMLEETTDTKADTIPHKIIIPKLPEGVGPVRIAHLQASAPYYKIVKMEDVLTQSVNHKEPSTTEEAKPNQLKLPDGTKLVNVNPLAHLLGNTALENIVGPVKVKKYYKPKITNVETAIAKAMMQLETHALRRRVKKKGVAVEQ